MPTVKPVHEIRLGSVRASIWEEETSEGLKHRVSVVRLYKDGSEWTRSTFFERDDLPLVAEVVDMAHLWIFEQAELIA